MVMSYFPKFFEQVHVYIPQASDKRLVVVAVVVVAVVVAAEEAGTHCS